MVKKEWKVKLFEVIIFMLKDGMRMEQKEQNFLIGKKKFWIRMTFGIYP